MTTLQSNRSHVLLTLGTLFAFGGASRFMPTGLASAEETVSPSIPAAVSNNVAPTEDASLNVTPKNEIQHQPVALGEVCLTGEAADKFSEDQWLFETEREKLRHKHIKLQSWEAELDVQTAELRDLQSTLEARWNEMQQQADQDVVHLAKMYSSMKAEQAAEIFNQMDPDFAAGFLMQLPSDQAGLILASMEKRKAYIVSVSMASDNADIRTD